MAIFGGIGKALGLGSAGQVAGAGVLAGLTGNPLFALTAFRGTEQGQRVALEQATQTTPQETQGSGVIQAGVPALLGTGMGGALVQGLRAGGRMVGSPQGIGFGLGLGAGEALDAFGGLGDPQYGQMPMTGRGITRKMQGQAKKLVELVGIEQAAAITGLSVAELAMILTKKFRARSQGISGAQLKSAQRTINKIVHMNNKLADAYGTAKRAPARRRTTTMAKGITQIKN